MLRVRLLSAARVWDRAVQTAGLSLLLLDENKSGSVAPPTGPRAPPRLPAGGGLGAGLRCKPRVNGDPRVPASRLLLGHAPASQLGPGTKPPVLSRLDREGLRWSCLGFSCCCFSLF